MKTVLYSFAYSLDFLREQVADVAAAEMVVQPRGIANHPAWVIGHLTYSCQELGGVVRVSPWLPADWATRFGTGSVPVADVRVYEAKEDALAMLHDGQERITRAVASLDDAQLDAPFPDPSYLALFPTVRHALTQVLCGHTAYHVGQIGLWRRAMGKVGIGRSFE